jgi:hypothetical protein
MILAGPFTKLDKERLHNPQKLPTAIVKAIYRRLEYLLPEHLSFGLEGPIEAQKGCEFEYYADELEALSQEIND